MAVSIIIEIYCHPMPKIISQKFVFKEIQKLQPLNFFGYMVN